MLRRIRFSIAGLMGVVLVSAVGFAALRNASEAWAGWMLLLTCGVLTLAVVGSLCRGPDERAGWLGFALFGWGYLALALWHSFSQGTLPTITLAEAIGSQLGASPSLPRRRHRPRVGIRSRRAIASCIACGRSRWPTSGA